MNRASRRAFEQAVAAVVAAFGEADPFPDQELTPPLLADAVRQCLDDCRAAEDSGESLVAGELDAVGRHALECLSDLGLWAWQLGLEDARAPIDDLAFDIALWIAEHGGRIAVLESAVNALARRADATRDPQALAALFRQACSVIGHAAPPPADDPAESRAWLTLHLNCAIIATRTQQAELMHRAYDLLESNLPGHCAAFFEEGARESLKPAYAGHVGDILRDRAAKWTARA